MTCTAIVAVATGDKAGMPYENGLSKDEIMSEK